MSLTEARKDNVLNPDVDIYLVIDNIFRSNEHWPNSVFDCVILYHDRIPEKFWGLFIKEMFHLVAPGGKLILNVEKQQTKFQAWQLRQRFFNILAPITNYEICETEYSTIHHVEKGKISETKNDILDEIESWTFGLVTNGDRDVWVLDFVQSVISQGIPHYEIIICGKIDTLIHNEALADLAAGNILKFIDFNLMEERGWITKKKNLIAEAAKFANMAIFHDRYELDKSWFLGMKKYGNNFEVLSCVNVTKEGERSEDWSRYPDNILATTLDRGWLARESKIIPSFPILMDYRDWDENVFIPGGMIIIKKYVWRKVKWDERLYWNEQEDVWLSHMQCFFGIISRFNIHSRVIVKSKRGNTKITLKYSPIKRGLPSPFLRYALSQFKGVFKRLIK